MPGPGRGPIGKDGVRHQQVGISFAHIEIAAIDELASEADMSRSEYVWRHIVGLPEVEARIKKIRSEGWQEPPIPPKPGTPEYYAS